MNVQQVEIYLEAENDVANKNYVEAFRKYSGILFEEPGNAPTHNSLGWIYKTQLDDYVNAEKHYKAALNGDPGYPHAYLNYMILLMDLERFADLENLVDKAMEVEAVDKSWLYHRMGLVRELQLRFDDAVSFYEKAVLLSLNDEKIRSFKEDIERTNEKKVLASKFSNWLGKSVNE
jgi:tetratricopeptide (TPR) repeat protein